MKKTQLFALLLALSLSVALTGCGGRLHPELPEDATAFALEDYVNPADPEDGYAAFVYQGRTYLYYGTVKRGLRAEELGPCLGYMTQEGEPQEDLRICLLTDDPEANYLVRVPINGLMEQPDFFRALDTAGKDIETPDYIQSLEYPIWEAPAAEASTTEPATETPASASPTAEPSATDPHSTERSGALDDSYLLEGYSFRLHEITPRDFLSQGWELTDAVFMRSMGADNPYAQLVPKAERKDPDAQPSLSEDGLLDPDGMVQLYLRRTDSPDSSFNPLRLGVVNRGQEALSYLDCPIYFYSVNETKYYEGAEEGLVEFSGPNGIRLGMEQTQLTALLGEPVLEDGDEEMKGLFYLTPQLEELVLLLDADGCLKAMFYQDLVLYDPADYVFHN